MLRTVIAAGLLCGLLGGWRLVASPVETSTPVSAMSLVDADCLSHDLSRSLESAGFRLRYLGGLANPQSRRLLESGHWAATGVGLGWEGTELSLDLGPSEPGTPYVLRRTIGRRMFEVVVTGAGQDLNEIDLDDLKSKHGVLFRAVFDKHLALSRDLTPMPEEPKREFYEQLWELEREEGTDRGD